METKQLNTPQQTETPNGKAAVLGLQHLLAMYAGAVAVPLLIGTGLNFDSQQMTYLISIDIFMCGVATLLQLTVNKFFGIGLPVVLGCAIQAVAPLIMIGTNKGVGAIYGSIIASGIFVVLIAGFFSKIKRLFPPLVTGTVITVIGLTLIPVAVEKMGGGLATDKSFGDAKLAPRICNNCLNHCCASLGTWLYQVNCRVNRPSRRHNFSCVSGISGFISCWSSYVVSFSTAILFWQTNV